MWRFWNIAGSKAVKKTPEPIKNKSMITPEKFASLTGIVIDNFEGGYYHPNMLPHFKPSDQAILRASGETMFGLDRKAGAGQLAAYDGWNEFWGILDSEGAATHWKHNYIPPDPLKTELKNLTSKIMFSWYNHLAGKYLNSAAQTVISNDDRLIIHISYGCWNGEGWFQKFASALNSAATNPDTTKEKIFQQAIKARTESSNKVIRQQGVNMIALFRKLHLMT